MSNKENKLKLAIDNYIHDKYLLFTNLKDYYSIINVQNKDKLYDAIIKLMDGRMEIKTIDIEIGDNSIIFDTGKDVYCLINYDDGTVEC
ncbi:hypothetical protein G8S55_12195 [Clostridium botulinum C]|uniref:hypothetical protein n=1 Tax=Clostridium botulinum TaxID=1491 RepID=UPI001E36AA1F|nr:hypothetical protein [Clostridium botulinum]MCD3217972.1 hypothetical protein [Clostridium botulinum C]